MRLGRVFRAEQGPNLAQKIVERALGVLPDEASLHAALGYSHVDAHRPVAAAKSFRAALAQEHNEPVLVRCLVAAASWPPPRRQFLGRRPGPATFPPHSKDGSASD